MGENEDNLVPRLVQQTLEDTKRLKDDGTEFWSARDLMDVLGYQSWAKFESAIEKAIVACEQSGQNPRDHFAGAVKLVSVGSGAERRTRDYHLTRYACYLVAQNGDSRKPQIAMAQTYFAIQTRRQELADIAGELEQRKNLRDRVIDHNKGLASAAKDSGVVSSMFGVFHDAGYRGLYGGVGVRDLKDMRGLDQKDDLLDHMGRTELAANDFRITQTEEKLRKQNIKGQQQAIDTHREVGSLVRRTIEKIGGTMPEELPVEASIRPLIEKERREIKRLMRGSAQKKS